MLLLTFNKATDIFWDDKHSKLHKDIESLNQSCRWSELQATRRLPNTAVITLKWFKMQLLNGSAHPNKLKASNYFKIENKATSTKWVFMGVEFVSGQNPSPKTQAVDTSAALLAATASVGIA